MLGDNSVNYMLAETELTSSDRGGHLKFLKACVLLSCKIKHSHSGSHGENNLSACALKWKYIVYCLK